MHLQGYVMRAQDASGLNGRFVNLLDAELNPICHLLALLGDATIVVVSRLRVKVVSSQAH